MANTAWGALSWSAGTFGGQNDADVLVTGQSLTSVLNSASISLNAPSNLNDVEEDCCGIFENLSHCCSNKVVYLVCYNILFSYYLYMPIHMHYNHLCFFDYIVINNYHRYLQ